LTDAENQDGHRPNDIDVVDSLIDLVNASERIVAFTGAGISTESGIPDYRGPGGVWERQAPPTIGDFLENPETRRAYWESRRTRYPELAAAQPNAGHLALAALERAGRLTHVITQNIDGLHQAAGSDPDRVVEVHGTLHEVMCMACGERAPMERALDRVRAGEDDPDCRTCGGILKSATISFGQNLVVADLVRAEAAARRCDLLLAVGSTLSVYPAAGLVPVARQSGAVVVIVNGSETAMDDLADVVLRGSISDLLPQVVGP
jgi:NAD-dependent deacetylase